MECLDSNPAKLCVVQGPSGAIVRSITDGDVRRALLAGASLDNSVNILPEQAPISVKQEASRDEMLSLMRSKKVASLLVLNDEGELVDVVDRSEIEDQILLSPPHLSQLEITYIKQALDDNWVAPAGPNLLRFETELAQKVDRSHALALSSGSGALHLALRVLDVGPGDRVYVSDMTFIASVQPIFYEQAIPVLIDADPEHWNMSVPALERQLAKDHAAGTLPKALVVVHLYGQSADMGAIMQLAESYGVPVVEDAAESLGASYRNRPSGTDGVLAAYSFNGNKIITTSGGGALVSDRQDLIDHARKLSTQGRDTAEHYQHSEVAYNYRMSNILAGIGLGQLSVLDDRVRRRREIFDLYKQELSDIDGITFQGEPPDSRGNRWLSVIAFDPDKIAYHPYTVLRRMRERGLETRPAWKPMHMQPLCRHLEFMPHSDIDTVSSSLFLRSLCLPSGTAMTDEDVRRVAGNLCEILAEG